MTLQSKFYVINLFDQFVYKYHECTQTLDRGKFRLGTNRFFKTACASCRGVMRALIGRKPCLDSFCHLIRQITKLLAAMLLVIYRIYVRPFAPSRNGTLLLSMSWNCNIFTRTITF